MPTTNYHTVNGEIIGETVGGQRMSYLTDGNDSVTGTQNASGNIANTYRYKPFGGLLAKTGAAADPRFLWGGGHGSRYSAGMRPSQYNRARHYDPLSGTWSSADPLWPEEPSFIFVNQNPTSWTDPFGLQSWENSMVFGVMLGIHIGELCGNPAKKCCCCPTSLRIKNIREKDDLNLLPWAGHAFEVPFNYEKHEIKPPEKEGECTLEWWEKTNIPFDKSPANTWVDQMKNPEHRNAYTFKNWHGRDRSCPGPRVSPLPLPDTPGLGLHTDKVRKKTLCIRIILKQSPGCNCSTGQIEVSFKQVVHHNRRKLLKRTYQSPISKGDRYCKR